MIIYAAHGRGKTTLTVDYPIGVLPTGRAYHEQEEFFPNHDWDNDTEHERAAEIAADRMKAHDMKQREDLILTCIPTIDKIDLGIFFLTRKEEESHLRHRGETASKIKYYIKANEDALQALIIREVPIIKSDAPLSDILIARYPGFNTAPDHGRYLHGVIISLSCSDSALCRAIGKAARDLETVKITHPGDRKSVV